jgi:alpha-glucosidase
MVLLLLGLACPSQALDFDACQPIGNVSEVRESSAVLTLQTDQGALVTIAPLAPDLIRVRVQRAHHPVSPDRSWAVAEHAWPAHAWHVQESEDRVELKTSRLIVDIQRQPLMIRFRDLAGRIINQDGKPMALAPDGHGVAAFKTMGFEEHFYGLGEKPMHLDHRREFLSMWNTDNAFREGQDPVYQDIPFYIGLENGRAYGIFFDNTWRSYFDIGNKQTQYVEFGADDGDLDYYFMYGPSMGQVVERYVDLTGHIPLPPRWALGNQQSRYSYYPDTQAETLVRRYREEHLPLDAIHLDIHYMDGRRIFTWNPDGFPDPSRFTQTLARQGVHVITIVDPGVKYQPEPAPIPSEHPELGSHQDFYQVFWDGYANDVFAKRQNGALYIGQVWPGESVFVDYTEEKARRWWGDQFSALLDHGVAGIWEDMNEPSDFTDMSGKSQADVVFEGGPYDKIRNVFALLESRATYEGLQRLRPDVRPFIITRAAYAGIQRYATMWTGDNFSDWNELAISLPEFMNLGLSGETFVGQDIGGFMGRCNGEMLARWYQVGCLTPLCRNHHSIDSYDQEPWRFGDRTEAIVLRYLQLRYRLMPYLYTVLADARAHGAPWFRPLVFEFQEDRNTYDQDDEFMVGPSLLAAPVLAPRVTARDVYLPRGTWYDFWTGRRFTGHRTIRVAAPLEVLPLFVRGGTALPTTLPADYVEQHPDAPWTIDVYPDAHGNARLDVYDDDGSTPDYERGISYRRTVVFHGDQVDWLPVQGSYRTLHTRWTLRLHDGHQATASFMEDFRPHHGILSRPSSRATNRRNE